MSIIVRIYATGEVVEAHTAAQYWARVDAKRVGRIARRAMRRDVWTARYMKRVNARNTVLGRILDAPSALATIQARMREVARG